MSKPTIAVVPGAWHSPDIYSKVIELLSPHGYQTIGISYPSTADKPTVKDFTEDVSAIKTAVEKLVVVEEKEVIVVLHSYAGMPGTQALEGLGRKDRAKQGLKGGVVRLVYIMAFAMPEGWHPREGGKELPDWIDENKEEGYGTVSVENARRIFYNDMTPEAGTAEALKLKPHSTRVYDSTTTYAAWRYIPSTYVILKKDMTSFTPELVDFMISNARKIEPTAFDVVETCDTDHSAMIGRPEWVTGVIRRAAGEKV